MPQCSPEFADTWQDKREMKICNFQRERDDEVKILLKVVGFVCIANITQILTRNGKVWNRLWCNLFSQLSETGPKAISELGES